MKFQKDDEGLNTFLVHVAVPTGRCENDLVGLLPIKTRTVAISLRFMMVGQILKETAMNH